MNKYIQEYLKQKEENEKKRLANKAHSLIQHLEIGEKVYSDDPKYQFVCNDFPKYDSKKKMSYKYDIGDATTEDYMLLLQKCGIEDEKIKPMPIEKAEKSGWHSFATAMIIISIIVLIVLGIISINEDDVLYFLIGLGGFIPFSLLCAIVQLLAGIKQCFDTNLKNNQ